MPLEVPVLDDRNFEEILEEAKRRIPVHTPEWTNFDVESDPGITLVQLFSFLTDSLLYRANRVPEANRLKFLQLLDVPLQPASAARGMLTIRNDRGPTQALPLATGVVVAAGNVNFLTRDGVNVLPVEGRVFYKRAVDSSDPRFEEVRTQFLAAQAAEAAALDELSEAELVGQTSEELRLYETLPLDKPTPGHAYPNFDVARDSLDGLYLALLAPENADPDAVRSVIANQTLSVGVVPALADEVDPLRPQRTARQREVVPTFICEIPDVSSSVIAPRYRRLRLIDHPNIFDDLGIVQLQLPDATSLTTWEFSEPQQEGVGALPPQLEDERIQARLLTWIRLRLSEETNSDPAAANGFSATAGAEAENTQATDGQSKAKISWIGINATRIIQAIPIVNELLGTGNGEPDQEFTVSTPPLLPDSVLLEVEVEENRWQAWRLVDDLLAADDTDEVFILDPEAGRIRFGDGLRGARPQAGHRIRISYEHGGGVVGNVEIGTINRSADVRLQAGYKVSNPIATYGGDDGETVAEGERNIPLYLRHRDRLVTETDFKNIVERTPGVDVGRVEVLSLYNPVATPREPAPGTVTVLVIPQTDVVNPLWPVPDRLFLRTVCDAIAPRRLVTTEIYVRAPEYVSVYITIGIEVREGYFQDVVRQEVEERLRTYLSSLPPGGPDAEGWPLNRQLHARELEAVATRVAGVEFVLGLEMGVNEALSPIETELLSGLQLPRLAGLIVSVGTVESLSALTEGSGDGGADVGGFKPVPVARAKC